MNANNAKDYLPLVQALSEGKVIQYKWSDGGWRDGEHLSFEKEPNCYRIKPEPREIWVNEYSNGGIFAHGSANEAANNLHALGVTRRYREVIE